MKYGCMYTNICVQVSMCTNAIREEYSPISRKYLIPRARVHVCTWAAKGLSTNCRRKEGDVMRVFRERKYKKERTLERENLGFGCGGERKGGWVWN